MEGRWDAFEGQKFQEFNEQVHGFDFECPQEWETFGAFDWGYARPWAYVIFKVDFDGRLYVDKYYYGMKENMPNVGVRMTDVEIARQIKILEGMEKVRFRVAGHDIFSKRPGKDGIMGPSPAENMAAEGIFFVKADNNRIPGWQQMHNRLKLDEDGEPWLKIRRSLTHIWRTVPALQEDPNNPEDIIKKDIEDHLAEAIRYGCMTRPMRPKIAVQTDQGSFQAERRKLIKAKQLASRQGISLSEAYRKI